MKDWLSLIPIRCARMLTTWGFTDDYLAEAEKQQDFWITYRKQE